MIEFEFKNFNLWLKVEGRGGTILYHDFVIMIYDFFYNKIINDRSPEIKSRIDNDLKIIIEKCSGIVMLECSGRYVIERILSYNEKEPKLVDELNAYLMALRMIA